MVGQFMWKFLFQSQKFSQGTKASPLPIQYPAWRSLILQWYSSVSPEFQRVCAGINPWGNMVPLTPTSVRGELIINTTAASLSTCLIISSVNSPVQNMQAGGRQSYQFSVRWQPKTVRWPLHKKVKGNHVCYYVTVCFLIIELFC